MTSVPTATCPRLVPTSSNPPPFRKAYLNRPGAREPRSRKDLFCASCERHPDGEPERVDTEGADGDRQRARVLVLTTFPALCRLVARSLRAPGTVVICVSTSRECLLALRTGDVAALIIDDSSVGEQPGALLARIQAEAHAEGVPAAILLDPTAARLLPGPGGPAWFAKPFDPFALRQWAWRAGAL